MQTRVALYQIPKAVVPSATVHNNPPRWFIERDCVIITCPRGHEIGITGPMYDRHTIGEHGVVEPSVLCPVDECDFNSHVRLLDYDPNCDICCVTTHRDTLKD